ncbi:MAG: nucleotidyltransferase domain-containing protein [Acidimicrobiales bacterium]
MDFVRPVQAVIPGAQGRILAVLAQTTAELNLRTIARLSGVSVAQASRVLPPLVELGIIERRDVPPSAQFRYVHEHLAARAVSFLVDAGRTVVEELRRTATEIKPLPASVIVFGSFARREADATSDIDVVVVRPRTIDEDQARWRASLDCWRDGAQRLTGNRIEIVEVSEVDFARLLRSRKPFWLDVQRDGIVLAGRSLDALKGRRSA